MSDVSPRTRLTSIDWLRGLVMVLMLIDHTREYLHAESFWQDPTDLSVISTATFLTRWITHFCAPIFVFLAGLGVALQLQAGKPMPAVRRFLWTRGLWLIFLEFTFVRLGGAFQWNPWSVFGVAQVIWALGISMILLSGLLRLPRAWIITLGLILVIGHNLLDPITVPSWFGRGKPPFGVWGGVWSLLHQSNVIAPLGGSSPYLRIDYPIIPWPGVMTLGYALGAIYGEAQEDRRRILFRLGMASIVCFLAVRALNHYGDPSHWAHQPTAIRTVLSFVNTSKYPPSLCYLLMTIGPGLLLLAWREGQAESLFDKALITFGRVPLFFYLLQWPVAHGLAVLFHFVAGKDWRFLLPIPAPFPADAGFKLGGVYLGWVIGLGVLYPLCRWFAGVKARRKDWWLSYL